jgi:hypothetical protein
MSSLNILYVQKEVGPAGVTPPPDTTALIPNL